MVFQGKYQESYLGMTIAYEPKILRLTNDDALEKFLDVREKGALALAGHMKEGYAQRIGRTLDISQESIAVEILGHVFVDEMAEKIQGLAEHAPHLLAPLAAAMEKIRRHTDVIDIGEKDVDSNRWVWDGLTPFRGIVFALEK